MPSIDLSGRCRRVLAGLLLGHLGAESACLAQPFAGDINRWVAQDALEAPPAGAVLFIGSSSIRRYEQLALDFADYEVIQRGFGGSQFDHVNRYADRIVLPYQPSAIVVWEGTNDIAGGDTGDEVFADYREFVERVHTTQPDVEIFYLGIMPTPGRFALEEENKSANAQVANFAAANPKLHYIDIPSAFHALDPPDSPAFNALFADSIHLSRRGYDLWTSVIRPQLEAIVPPNKAYAPNPLTLKPGQRLLFDFGPSNADDGDPTVGLDANGNVWNNWHAAEGGEAVNAGEHLSDLVNTEGEATGIDLTITGGFATNGKQQGGLLDPDPELLGEFAVATATQDYFFSSADGEMGGGNDDRPGGFMLDGLDPQQSYTLRFFGSHSGAGAQATEYRVTGADSEAVVLATSGGDGGGNTDTVISVDGVRPDRFGQVFVDLTLKRGEFAYLNAMELFAVPGEELLPANSANNLE